MEHFHHNYVHTISRRMLEQTVVGCLAFFTRYFTGCAFAALILTGQQASAETIAIPCVNGGGSGGWMYSENLPSRYFPLGVITVNEWPLRSIATHPMYDRKAPWNKYGTCIVVPARYP